MLNIYISKTGDSDSTGVRKEIFFHVKSYGPASLWNIGLVLSGYPKTSETIYTHTNLHWPSHIHAIRVHKKKEKKLTSIDKDVGKRERFCSIGVNVKWGSHFGKKYGSSSNIWKIKLPYHPAIYISGYIY